MPYPSVRNVWQLYQREGRVVPHYHACGRFGIRAAARVYRGALWLKRQHPTWGAPLIRVLLQQKWPQETVPHERTLQRWFHQAGIQRPRHGRQPRQPRARGAEPHAVWEMDSKEQLRLATGECVSWLVVSDEASGAALQGTVFPPGVGEPDQRRAGASLLENLLRPLGLAADAAGG